jgi:glutamate synthase (NADPH/NADH) small chain
VLCGALEAFVADFERSANPFNIRPEAAGGRYIAVAVVGSGPSGLACAEQLALRGYGVTVFESAAAPGGLLTYGIPGFKLEKTIVRALIEDLRHAGVEFRTGTAIGKENPIDHLLAGDYHAVYLATGSSVPTCLQVPGADLQEIYPPDEFLARLNVEPEILPAAWREPLAVGKKVVVIGGGDTASDCLRTALRVGADHVTCLYRRTEAEMPGGKKDRALAREEGAEFRFLAQPVRFVPGKGGKVRAVECLECRLGEPDADGRCRPIPIDGASFTIEADTVVCALGYEADPKIGRSTPGLIMDKHGLLQIDPNSGETSRPGIFAGGDAVSGPDLVVTAMAAGRRAADSIDRFLLRNSES